MEWKRFRSEAINFIVNGDQLNRRGNRGAPIRRVIDVPAEKNRMMSGMHDECGHKGQKGTYYLLKTRVWWAGLYADVSRYVKSCNRCQFRSSSWIEKPFRVVSLLGLF